MTDLFSVQNKRVVVTGGSSGIGRMIAEGFVSGGAKVVIASRKADSCEAAAEALREFGDCTAIAADVSSDAGAANLASAVAAIDDGVDVLVNNAGTNWSAPLTEYPEEAFDKVIGLNLKGPFLVTRNFAQLLQKRASAENPSRVINIGSIDGIHIPVLETYAYSAGKAGLHHLTKVLGKQLAPQHITVNAIAPGPFPSKMMQKTLDDFGDMIRASVPMGRIGEPEDMAGVALYLASRAGSFVTGAVIPVDGGMATCR